MTTIEYMDKIKEQRRVFEDYKRYKRNLIPHIIVIPTQKAWRQAKERYNGNQK